MRKQVLAIVLIVMAFTANAQFKLGVKAGPSIPLSDFKGKYSLVYDGFAKTGFMAGLEIDYKFYKNFDLALSLDWQAHNIALVSLKNRYQQVFGETVTRIYSDKYIINNVLLKPGLILPINNLNIKIAPQAGLTIMRMPYSSITTENGVDASVEDWSTAFAMGGEIEIGCKLNKILISGACDYLYSKPEFFVVSNGVASYGEQQVMLLRPNLKLMYEF